MSTRVTASALAAVLLGACAHSPPPPAPEGPVWPAPPAQPLLRFEASFPDPSAAPPRLSFWRRALELFLGIEPADPSASGPLLVRPFGLAAVEGGFVVADPDARRVLRVDWPKAEARPITCAGHEWATPIAVAASPSGEIYVADAGAGLVARIDPSGACQLLGAGALARPTGVAWATDRLYAVDSPRHAVVAFAPDGREALRFGGPGEQGGQLHFPAGIAADAGGALLVVDTLNSRISRFAADGAWLGNFGEGGEAALGRPKGVAVDGQRVFVSDAQSGAVAVYGPGGKLELLLGQGDTSPGELSMPGGLATGGGRLYVADPFNHRVQVYLLFGAEP